MTKLNKCPNCKEECNYETEFKCFNCGEHFWQSYEVFQKNPGKNQNIKERQNSDDVHKINSYKSSNHNKHSLGLFKKILGGSLLFLLFVLGVSEGTVETVCERTLKYTIGDIDVRFNVSKDQIVSLMAEVEQIWELPTGFDVFEYDPTASFSVNFIFDERQEKTNKQKDIGITLDDLGGSLDKIDEIYSSKEATYKTRLYNYNNRMHQFNTDVEYWNNRGGAPDNIYNQFALEENYLKEESKRLEVLRVELNNLVGTSNSLVNRYNETISNYNSIYGDSVRFTQGAYFGDRIEIYEFEDLDFLKLVLAHEFGHALNIDHVTNPEAIMYHLMGEQPMPEIALTPEDITALNTQCD